MYFPRAHHDRQPSSTDLLLVMNWLFRNVFGFTQPASIPHRKLALSSFCCCGGGAQRYYYYYYYYHPHHCYAHLLLLLFTVSQSAIHPSDHPSNDLPVGYPKNSMPWDRQMNYIYLPVIHKYHFYSLSPASSLTYSYSDSVGRRQTGRQTCRDDDDEDGASFRKTIIVPADHPSEMMLNLNSHSQFHIHCSCQDECDSLYLVLLAASHVHNYASNPISLEARP